MKAIVEIYLFLLTFACKTSIFMTLYPKLITDALATVIYPGTKKNLIESEMLVEDVHINGMEVTVTRLFPRETDPFLKSI